MASRSDNFNRADSSTLGTPSDSGSDWVSALGGGASFGIAGNQAKETFDGGVAADYLECGSADGEVQVTLTVFGDQMGVCGRLTDGANFFWVRVYSGAGLDLYRREASANNNIGSYGYTPANGDVIKLVMSGNSLSVYLNGTLRIGPVTDAFNNTATKHGMFASGTWIADTARWEDFSFTDGGADTTPPTLSARTVPSGGTTLTATLSESGCVPASGTGGFTLGGTAATVASWVISGTTLTLTLSGTVYQGETVTLTYARASTTDDIADAATNYLADFSGAAVTNNSTQLAPLVAGTASFVSSGTAGIVITATDATGGDTPYTYQWQRNSGGGAYGDISNGGGVSGATTLTITDDSATPGTLYGYRLVYTDDAATDVTSNAITAQVYTGGALSGGGFGRGGMNGGING
jgi:hypothetical protein